MLGSSRGGAGVRARRWEICNGSSGGWDRGQGKEVGEMLGSSGGGAGVRARRWEKCNGSSGGGVGVRNVIGVVGVGQGLGQGGGRNVMGVVGQGLGQGGGRNVMRVVGVGQGLG